MVRGGFGIVAGDLLGSKGVDLRADTVHRIGDLKRSAFIRPLEHHVFDEVRYSVFAVRFKGRAGAHDDARTDRPQPLDLLHDEP